MHGSVAVAIAAASDMIQHYGGGLLDDFDTCGDTVDHAVVVVGYSTSGNYWLIRNSWGTGWGLDGYMQLSMEVPDTHQMGLCGILTSALQPGKAHTVEPGTAGQEGAVQVDGGSPSGDSLENAGLVPALATSAPTAAAQVPTTANAAGTLVPGVVSLGMAAMTLVT